MLGGSSNALEHKVVHEVLRAARSHAQNSDLDAFLTLRKMKTPLFLYIYWLCFCVLTFRADARNDCGAQSGAATS
jgi:hypothetical protein